MPAASQLRFLTRLRRDLENGNSETWGGVSSNGKFEDGDPVRHEIRKVWGPVGQRKGKGRSCFRDGAVWRESVTYGSFEKGVIPPPIRPDERSTELHPYSPGLCTSLSPGGWPPILDLPISNKIPGSIRFSIKVILFLFLYIWVRAAFPRYRYDQLMGLGRKVFLPLSLARVVPVSGVLVTFQWLP